MVEKKDEMRPPLDMEGPPPPPKGIRKVPSAKMPEGGVIEADVVIIGGGGAGIPAAVSAFENGAKSVVMLEKRERAGGNAIMARGIFGCESSVLRNAMVYSDKDEIFTNAMKWHHYSRVNGKLLRAYINQSGDTIEWLIKRGVGFFVDTTTRMNYHQDPTWHCVKNGNMALAMGKLFTEALELGLQFYADTIVTEIIIENGAVAGVKAVHQGQDLTVKAKAVIVSTGGFLANEEKVKQYFPYYSKDRFGGFQAPNMGEGIALAQKAGAALERECTLVREACAASDKAPRILSEFTREPYLLWVNKKGRRFVDETAGAELQICTNALMMQPDMRAYAIFDEGTLHYMMDKGFELSKGDDVRGCAIPTLKGKLEEIEKKAPESLKIADTLEEIAQWIGCLPEDLSDELAKYNSYAQSGYDKDFNKPRRYLAPCHKGPFYAIMHMAIAVDTVGPVRIDHETRVLDDNYNPIPGLYGAGVITAGWQSNDYCGQYLFGSALSYSINSGRIAGRNAAGGLA
ncbi:MAG: FAD-binding protein [Clostridiales bacterium]|jgi:fumarate reductase flavoprotein subunit|nr:FAD-binding protein [Clostridiales bacterium]